MKNRMNRTAAGVALALVLLAGGVQPVCAAASGPAVSLVWDFTSAANPAQPDAATGVSGASHATIGAGQFAEGWVSQLNGWPGTGFWDLGNSGSITLNNSTALVASGTQRMKITVKVRQYQDSGGLGYDQSTLVSVPGATAGATSLSTVAPAGNLGDWVVQETEWTLAPNSVATTIVVQGATAPKKGTVIDQIIVQATIVAPAPALSIRKVGTDNRQVEISWSAEFAGMELEASADPGNAAGWSKVQQVPQLSGGIYSVTLEASGAKFYRLKQP